MKKILSLLALSLLFVGFTSCGDDDDIIRVDPNDPGNNNDSTRTYLTPEERATQLREMQGVYSGWMYFRYNDYEREYKDSAKVGATITANDSLMVLRDMPLRIITNRIDKKYAAHLDSTAIIPPVEATVQIYLPAGKTAFQANTFEHWFWFLPRGKNYQVTFPIDYDGQQRDMTITFGANYSTFSSNGAFLVRRMLFNAIIHSVSLEGVFSNQTIDEILQPQLIKQ